MRSRKVFAGIVFAAAISLSVSACGGSNSSSDFSDASSAAMNQSDVPAGFTVNTAKTASDWASYSDPHATNFGKLGSHCGQSPDKGEKENFSQGLAQTALDSNALGIGECAQIQKNDDSAKSLFATASSKLARQKVLTIEKVDTVGDETIAASVTQGGVVGHVIGWRHGNALIELSFLDTKNSVSIDRLHTLAKTIDGQLK